MEEETKAIETQGAPETETSEAIPEKKAAFFSRKNLKRNIILAVSLVVMAAIVAIVLSAMSPQSVAKRYCLAAWKNDPAQIARCTAFDYKAVVINKYDDEEDFYEKVSDIYDEDIRSWKEYSKLMRESTMEEYEDEYGEYKITAKVTRIKNISERKLEEEVGTQLYEKLEEYGFDSDKITASKIITVKVKLIGEDGRENETIDVYMAKINGLWKVVTTK